MGDMESAQKGIGLKYLHVHLPAHCLCTVRNTEYEL